MHKILRHIFGAFVIAILAAACGCAGNDNKQEQKDAQVADSTQAAEIVNTVHVPFSEQTIAGARSVADSLISGRATPTASRYAIVAIALRSGVDRLSQQVELLVRNDDKADSYHVLSEYDTSPWIEDCLTLQSCLAKRKISHAALDEICSGIESENERVRINLRSIGLDMAQFTAISQLVE